MTRAMKSFYGATIGRITRRFDWDRPGVLLAALLFLGETVAVILAGTSLASEGYDGGRLAALIGAAVLALYVPLAIWQDKLPFASPTEYEKRRNHAQKKLGVKIPRSGDKTKEGWRLGTAQVHLEDDSDDSIRVAVGRAYCLGDATMQALCDLDSRTDVKQNILLAKFQLIPPTASFSAISAPPELMRK